jgi:DNA-binding MltR family transcriptional regulator
MAAVTEFGVLEMLKRQGMDIEAVIKQSQAGSVLIMAQQLDNLLEHVLTEVMQPVKKDDWNTLFRGTGPLSVFSSKIRIAYGFGLLSKEASVDAHLVRGIRNKFAHAEERISFDSDEIKELLKKLSTAGKDVKPKDAFVHVIEKISRHLIQALHERIKGREDIPRYRPARAAKKKR